MTAMRAFFAAGVLVLGFGGPALAAGVNAGEVGGTATARFAGSSTLHGFSGAAAPATFVLEPSPTASWAALVEVPVAGLSTDNSLRDKKMREMLHADEHPTIRAKFADVVPHAVRTSGRLPFKLSIADVERELTAEVSDWRQTDQSVELDASFTLSLSDFQLEAPGALFLRVDDSVKVDVHVVLVRR
jgi:polyisoprenoid-binding protein YceI